jgi:hypothetical protein
MGGGGDNRDRAASRWGWHSGCDQPRAGTHTCTSLLPPPTQMHVASAPPTQPSHPTPISHPKQHNTSSTTPPTNHLANTHITPQPLAPLPG